MPSAPTTTAEPAAPDPGAALRFGRFELRPLERRLLVDGEPAVLGARAFDLLLALADRPGLLMTKHALMEAVWPGLVVEENNLAAQVSALRKVLGGELIATIPGRGYRFTARPQAVAAGAGEAGVGDEPDVAAPTSPVDVPPPPAPATGRPMANLPARLQPLHGRGDDLEALGALVDGHRLVSLVGPGGMGKTLLAQHLLTQRREAHPDGVCWVELAALTDGRALRSAVAGALGVKPAGGDPLDELCAAVQPLSMLLALDNAEQLVGEVADVVSALLDAAPGLHLLVTSQVPLQLPEERVYRLGALAVPPGPLPAASALAFGAVALFVERARAADARFVLGDANAPVVIELCRALDGLALAIELAAARAPMLGVQRLAGAMQDRLKLLTSSRNRDAPARHQTLRATLEWSHGLLDERERTVFRRLAVFAGSGSLEAMQRVAADPPGEGGLDPWAVLDALGVLVERSLVAVLPLAEAADPRYRLPDSLRLYALERLREAGEEAALRERHARAMADHFDAADERRLDGSVGLEAWREELARDLDNAREAIAWARSADEPTVLLRTLPALVQALPYSAVAECAALADLAAPRLTPAVPPGLRARLWLALIPALTHADPARARDGARRAVEAAREQQAATGDGRLLYLALFWLAMQHADEPAVAEAAWDEALALERSDWPAHLRFMGGRDADAPAGDAGRRPGRAKGKT